MGADLYTLRKKGVMVISPAGERRAVYLLQLVISNALAPDVQALVDRAILSAYREWREDKEFPEWVVQVGRDGQVHPGCAIHNWRGTRRVCAFETELLRPEGYVGDKALGGYGSRSVAEQQELDDLATARSIDEGSAKVYRNFWSGETFRSGAEFLAYRRGEVNPWVRRSQASQGGGFNLHPKLSKILDVIRIIEFKGNKASEADTQFLRSLRQKAAQLGYPIHSCT